MFLPRDRAANGDVPPQAALRLLAQVSRSDEADATLEAALEQAASAHEWALRLVDAYASREAGNLNPDPDELVRVARGLTRLAGPAVVRDVLAACLEASPAEQRPALSRLADVLGHDSLLPALGAELAAGFEKEGRSLASALADKELGAWEVAGFLMEQPTTLRAAFAKGLLAQAERHPEAPTLLAVLAFQPFDASTRALVWRALARRSEPWAQSALTWLSLHASDPGAQAEARRSRITAQNRAKEPAPHALVPQPDALPLPWPVIEAWVGSLMPGGRREVMLVRRRPDGAIALAGALLDPETGLAEGFGNPAMAPEEYRDFLLSTRRDGARWRRETPARVGRGLARAMQRAEQASLPLPHEFQRIRYLLAGVPGMGF